MTVDGDVQAWLRTHSCYDTAGDLVSVTAPNAGAEWVDCDDPPGHTETFAYDALGRALRSVDADGNADEVAYDPNGNVVRAVDAAGAVTRYGYDQRGLVTRVDAPLDGQRETTMLLSYDAAGNRVEEVSPRAFDTAGGVGPFTEFVTTTTFDGVGRPVTVELPSEASERAAGEGPAFVHYFYDAAGRLDGVSEPTLDPDRAAVGEDLESLTRVEYFDAGWVRTSAFPGLPRVRLRFHYSAQGWQASRVPVDPDTLELVDDERMSWSYLPDGLLSERRDVEGNRATFGYDAGGLLTRARDAPGLVDAEAEAPVEVRAVYDSLGRAVLVRDRKERVDAPWQVSALGYDRDGNVLERVDEGEWDESSQGLVEGSGRRHEFAYSEAGRVRWHVDVDADGGARRAASSSFDAAGREVERVIAREDAGGGWGDVRQTTAWQWLAGGLLERLEVRNGAGSVLSEQSVSYVDAAGVFADGHRVAEVFRRDNPDE